MKCDSNTRAKWKGSVTNWVYELAKSTVFELSALKWRRTMKQESRTYVEKLGQELDHGESGTGYQA